MWDRTASCSGALSEILQSWLEPAPTFLGVGTGEILNTKGTHVGMNGDVVLDRSSTLLTSIFKTVAQKSDRFAFYKSKYF